MIPGSFAYHRPTSVREAIGLLADLGEEARPLAGGHSLIPMMKLRLAEPEHLVDLAGIPDLKGIRADGLRPPRPRRRAVVPRHTTRQIDFYASVEVAA